jgi:hypothetical protein
VKLEISLFGEKVGGVSWFKRKRPNGDLLKGEMREWFL